MDPLLVAYLTFTFILVVTPGSTTAVVVRNTLRAGRSGGLAAAAGAAVGNTSHAAAAGMGLAVVVARWPDALGLLRLAGAAYLAWLGLNSVYKVAKFEDGGMRLTAPSGTPPAVHRHSFREGLAVNLLNPVIATFYLVVVPTFLPAGAPRWYFAALASIHIGLALACHGVWALGLDRLRRLFHPPATRRVLEGATGIALLGLAVRVLVQ